MSVNCFVRGSRIATLRGDVAVEQLQVGDSVLLAAGGSAEIVWIGQRRIDTQRHRRPWDVRPVRIAAGAFAPGQPCRDLLLSPDHAIFTDNVLIPVRYLINGATITQEPGGIAHYWHIELAEHATILAEGLPVETYLDTGNRSAFTAAGPSTQLHPAFARQVWQARGCAPLVVDGPQREVVRSWLHHRAGQLGHAVTADAGLHLIVDGVAIWPSWTEEGYGFVLPDGTREVRIASRTLVPAEMEADSDDTRRLGVAVTQIILDGQPIALDDPRLAAGWHGLETDWRWTTGNAGIRCDRGDVLEIRTAKLGRYWLRQVRDDDARAA